MSSIYDGVIQMANEKNFDAFDALILDVIDKGKENIERLLAVFIVLVWKKNKSDAIEYYKNPDKPFRKLIFEFAEIVVTVDDVTGQNESLVKIMYSRS